MPYSHQLMNYADARDYSGLVRRIPTEKEIKLILEYEVKGIMEGLQEIGRYKMPQEEKVKYREQFMNANLPIARETDMVYDFSSINTKVFVYYNISINDVVEKQDNESCQTMQFQQFRYIIDGENEVTDFYNEDAEFEI